MSIQTTTNGINWDAVSTIQKPSQPKRQPQDKPCHCLILHCNGELRVFGADNLRPLILNLPEVHTIDAELGLEQLIDEILPRAHKDIHWPGNLRGSGWCKNLTVAEFQDLVELARLDSRLFAKSAWTGGRAMLEVISR